MQKGDTPHQVICCALVMGDEKPNTILLLNLSAFQRLRKTRRVSLILFRLNKKKEMTLLAFMKPVCNPEEVSDRVDEDDSARAGAGGEELFAVID